MAEHTVTAAGTTGMSRAETGTSDPTMTALLDAKLRQRTVALAYEFHRLPAQLRVATRPLSPQITASVLTHARLQAGLVDLDARVRCRIEKRSTDTLRLKLDEGLLVLDVAGQRVVGWNTQEDVLEVRLTRSIRGACEFTLTAVQHLRRVDGVLWCHRSA